VSVKNAVLGLLVERPGYGYDVIQRFNARFAPWDLNSSTVYAAIDALFEQRLIAAVDETGTPSDSRARPPKRSPKVRYEPTPEGRERFLTWLTAPLGKVEPVRGEIFLRLGLAKREHALALLQVIDAQIGVCTDALAEQLAGYQLDPDGTSEVPWRVAAGYLLNDAAIGRLQTDLAWLRRVRASVEALRTYGFVPRSMLLSATTLPAGWQ